MSDRFFLDMNIFVYSFERNAPRKAERAARLVRRGIETGEGSVSYQGFAARCCRALFIPV
jgi:predicted nucleic acid-binding protein